MTANIFFFTNPFRLDKKRIVTLSLIVFITFVVWFSQSASALSVIVNTPSGIVNWAPGAHVVDWNVSGAGAQTDFNTSVNTYIYSGTKVGAKTTLLSTIVPLFESINPDSNSQGYIRTEGLNAPATGYDATTGIDGIGSFKISFCVTAGCNTTLFYSGWEKQVPDTNIVDINRNGGKFSYWAKTDRAYAVSNLTIYFTDGCYYTTYSPLDENNVWKKITIELNKFIGGAVCDTVFNHYKSIWFEPSMLNPIPADTNVWFDGARIYDNKNCVAFDGNSAQSNVNCSKTITTSADVNGYITIAAQSGDLNVQASSGSFQFTLVDEETGLDINFFDYNRLKFYVPDSNTVFDFNANNTKSYTWYDFVGRTGYLEIIYQDSVNTRINKYFNSEILATDFANSDGKIRICVAKYQQFYQQIFVSTSKKPIIMYNQTADCYSIASYTDQTYGSGFGVQAYSINRPYIIYTISNGVFTSLSNMDGSLASIINLDALEFNLTKTSLTISNDQVSFGRIFYTATNKYDENILQIRYVNFNNENSSITLKIYKDSNNFFTQTETTSPNDFTLNWNFAGYGLSDINQLKLVVQKTLTDGTTKNYTIYFNIAGTAKSGVLDAIVAIVFAMLLMLAGITMFSTNYSLGWLGVLLTFIAIGVLALAPDFWYVRLFQLVLLGIAAFIGLIWKNENAGVT